MKNKKNFRKNYIFKKKLYFQGNLKNMCKKNF